MICFCWQILLKCHNLCILVKCRDLSALSHFAKMSQFTHISRQKFSIQGTKNYYAGLPSEDLRGPQKDILRPKQAVFDRFLELGGSKWASTVLDEQGIPPRCSGHPTSLYWNQKMSLTKLGRGNLEIGAK